MLKNFASITNKIYQWDFLKVAVLKRPTKGAMSRSFRRAYLIFYQQNIAKNAMLKNFVSIVRKIYHCKFPKVAVSKRSVIGAMSSSFRRAPCT